MRVGIFGGSFDPIHMGHLLLAEFCREQARLDQVWFVPAAQAPHKDQGPVASDKHRAEMIRLATWGHDAFRVCEVELERGGISYTVDTLKQIRQEAPQAELFLLMGADSLNDFPKWRQPQEICQLATLMTVIRGGQPMPDISGVEPWLNENQLADLKSTCVQFPAIELSSTDLRLRLREGRSIRYQTPRAVEEYLRTHGVYEGDA